MKVDKCEISCCQSEKAQTLVVKTQHPLAKKLSDLSNRLQPIIELICRIALALFAAFVNFKLFFITSGIGFSIGVAHTIYRNIIQEPIEVGLARPSCAQGFFDYLSNMRCPPLVSTVITAVFIGGHMHHSPFYIGFCGVPFGVWLGTQMTQVAWNLTYRDIYPMKAPLKNISDVFAPLPGD